MTVNKDGPEAGYWHIGQGEGYDVGGNNYQGNALDTVSRYSRTSRVSGRSNINRIISKNLKKNNKLMRTIDGRPGRIGERYQAADRTSIISNRGV